MSDFFSKVFEVVKLIPPGRVTSYGAIARYLGTTGSARMVGWALNKCDLLGENGIPAHRVLNRKGELSGRIHFSPPGLMAELLLNEGVEVRDNKVVDLPRYFWNPGEHLEPVSL